MTVYRYKAVPLRDMAGTAPIAGELAAESPAALRAALRRIELQAIDVRPARRFTAESVVEVAGLAVAKRLIQRRARAKRVRARAELYDSISTMLEAGMPVVEAIGTLARGRARSTARTMLVEMCERLRDGESLDQCMARAPWWFEEAEVAMVRASHASGELPRTLQSLADSHERAGALSAKLVGALTYPIIVLCVGVGVVMFLSTKTLPDLVAILDGAGVEPPRLTLAIMSVGRGLWEHGLLLIAAAAAIVFAGWSSIVRLRRNGKRLPAWMRCLVPGCVRRALLARAWSSLAELLRTGVPLTDSMRITAPTVGGFIGSSLAAGLRRAADDIERGSAVVDALTDAAWFDDECRRLIAIGESAGELPDILSRMAERSHRSADRTIDRLASLLEPAAILLLAVLIGIVVMGAVLPILRLQEIIG